jgi:hypothetical protein
MERFLNYLEERTPEWSRRLKAVGPANTGSREGAMPEAWRAIAAEAPKRFAQVQYDFIHKTHYVPALQDIAERTGGQPRASAKAHSGDVVEQGCPARPQGSGQHLQYCY